MLVEQTNEPTLDDVIKGLDDETPTEAAPEAPKSEPQSEGLSKTEEKLESLRKLRAAEKRIKELEERVKKASEATKPTIDLDSSNPIREIVKAKKLTQDDVVRLAMEAMDENGEDGATKIKTMTPEEIIAEAKAQLKKELEEEKNKAQEEEINNKRSQETEKIVNEFLTKNEEKYPCIKALAGEKHVYGEIERDYLQKVEEFGEDYAKKNILTLDEASKKINDALANQIKTALQSNHLRKLVATMLKDGQGGDDSQDQSDDEFQLEEEITLNNSQFKASSNNRTFDPSDEEENFKAALALLD